MNTSTWQTGAEFTPHAAKTYRAIIAGQEQILTGFSGESYPGKGVVLLHFAEGDFSRHVITRVTEISTQHAGAPQ